MQSSLPAGWLASTGRELNPLDRYKRFQITFSSPFSGLILAQGNIVANASNKTKTDENAIHFMTLYWGDMILVEDKEVREAMVEFSLEIKDFEGGWSGSENLKLKGNALIEACRRSVQKGTPNA